MTDRPALRCAAMIAALAMVALACGGSGSDSGTPTGTTSDTMPQLTHPGGVRGISVTIDGLPNSVRVSPTGKVFVASQRPDGLVSFTVDAPNPSPIALPDESFPSDIVFDRAGATVYLAGEAEAIVIDVASGAVKPAIALPGGPYRLALSSDDSRIFATDQERLFSAATTGTAPVITAQLSGLILGVALSPTGSMLYASSTNGTVWRLNPATLAIQATAAALGGGIGDIAVSPDGTRIYVVSAFGTLSALDATALKVVGSVNVGSGALGIAMSPDGAQIYVSTTFGGLAIVDRAALTIAKRLTLGGTPGRVTFDKLGTTAFVVNGDGWVDVIR